MANASYGDAINNACYDTLGDRWYTADDDPIALLRAESRFRNPWIAGRLSERFGRARVLDVGCGGGFLSNALGREGHDVIGLDASAQSLAIARAHDETGRVTYVRGDALHVPFEDASFDAVCAMDFLEHVDDPSRVVAEAARVLRPGGLFFFHTFNRNPLAWLVVIKGVEWFVRNAPPKMHILRFFVKPEELRSMCARQALTITELNGSAPAVFSVPFWRMLATGRVAPNFRFVHTASLAIAYSGVAERA